VSQNDCRVGKSFLTAEGESNEAESDGTRVDLAKRVFHLVGMDEAGHVVLKKRLTREALLPFIAQLSPVMIGMEACGGAHYWARRFRGYGHTVKLIAPQFVKPYVKTNKNDWADTEAICEAVTRPTMRFVPIKEVEQQDLQSLHRARERVVKARTALVNEIRGLAMEALVQFHRNRSVIESSRQIGLCLSYVIDPINPKMRAMTWNFCDSSARDATPLTYNIIRPILQRIMVAVSFTNVITVRSISPRQKILSWKA
jgi:hypothetical protein